MNPLSFSVRGVCVPYTRVIPGRDGGAFKGRAYGHWLSQVIDAARDAMARDGWKTTTAAVRVDVEIVFVRRPTKAPRKSESAHPIVSKSCGDLDNVAKGCLDGMQRALIFRNDAQVVELAARKRWRQPKEDFAGVIISVEII